jgi:hypothetical protein
VGPPRLPIPYGLFSVLALRPGGGGDRWENGISWEEAPVGAAGGFPDPDYGPPVVPIDLDLGDVNADGVSNAAPFTVYGYFQGNPMTETPESAQAKALDHLLQREEARVEQAFWTGDLGTLQALTGADQIASGTAQDYEVGLAALETAIARDYGNLGVIHMTRGAALIGLGKRVLEARNGRLFTVVGTPVVAGVGYDGSSPDGDAAPSGQSWAYVTPAVFGYRSEPFASSKMAGDLLDRGTNTLYAVAERTYVIGYESAGHSAALLKVS